MPKTKDWFSTPTPNPWLTSDQARNYLAISMRTLKTWVSNGMIKHGRTPGGELRFRKEWLDDAITIYGGHK